MRRSRVTKRNYDCIYNCLLYSFFLQKPTRRNRTIFLLNTIEKFAQPHISVIINSRIDSKHRATTLSTLALFSQIPYTILVLGFAYLTEPRSINILYGVYLFISVILLYAVIKISTKVQKQEGIL